MLALLSNRMIVKYGCYNFLYFAFQKKKMAVKRGAVVKEDPADARREEYSEYKLREKMIKNKHRKLYKSMMEGRQKRKKEAWLLRKKRRRIEEEEGVAKKEAKKQKKKAAASLEA